MQISALYRQLLATIRTRLTGPVNMPALVPEAVLVSDEEPVPKRGLTAQDRIHLKHSFGHNWNGITNEATLRGGWGQQRREWNAALESSDWSKVLGIIDKQGANPNEWQLSGPLLNPSLNTALHMVADGGAPLEVATALVELGGWRTVRNANGETPFDIALQKRHSDIVDILKPVILHQVGMPDLLAIEKHFHAHFNDDSFVEEHNLLLPQLAPLLELEDPKMWFPIPGMYGGVSYFLDQTGPEPKLIFESRCRVVGGPVPRREVTVSGSARVESVNVQ